VIDQKKMEFIPHVVVILQGTTVDFTNSDPVGHNVYWPSISGNKKPTHNLGTWPKGDKKSFQFNDLGVAPLLCNDGSHEARRQPGEEHGDALRQKLTSAKEP
jgi:plastocyanin